MKKHVNRHLLRVRPYVPGKPIEELQRQQGIKRVIKLASNENPYPPSPRVLRAIERAALKVNRYPDPDCHALRRVLARRLGVEARQLIFGNGSDELIVLAARVFAREGSEVVVAKPSFLIYDIASRLQGAVIKAIPLRKDFHYNLSAMAAAVTAKTRIIFLGNPDNPSGQYLTETALRAFVEAVPKDVLVFVDEAYFEYVQAEDYARSLNLLKRHRNVFVTRTFSKLYGLAGLRIGYGVGHPQLIDWFSRIREPFNVNSLAQAAALACLRDQDHYARLTDKIEGQRQYLYRSLRAMRVPFVETWTNFVLIELGSNAAEVAQQLLLRGIIVRDMSAWGMKRFIRVSLGTAGENRRFIKTLKEVL